MSSLKHSKTLDDLLERSRRIGVVQNGAAKAERFIVAVIEFAAERSGSASDNDAKNELETILANYLPFSSKDRSDVKADLLAHINETVSESYVGSVYMQITLKKARIRAEKTIKNELDACDVLTCIFEEPNEFLKEYISLRSKNARKRVSEEKNSMASDETPKKVVTGKPSEAAENETAEHESRKKRIADLTQKVKSIHDHLSSTVLGQENAVSVFTAGLFQAELLSMTDKDHKRPRATFLFAGPPGVGKTFLAEKAAEALELPFKRFDMSEYCDKEASVEFIGSDAVFKGAGQGNFTGFVSSKPKSVILLDEIEKAHISIIHLFLQILDAGRIRDSKTDQEISLADTILIFTTNAGRQLYEKSESGDFSGISRKVILKALMNDLNPETKQPYFPAAICSRFASGNVVMFNHMSAYNLRQIAKNEVLRNAEIFGKEIGIGIDIDEQVYTALLFAEGGSADARTMRSRAESFVNTELYELFRLLSSERNKNGIEKLESISISIELPEDNKEITEMFESAGKPSVMLAATETVVKKAIELCPQAEFFGVQSVPNVKRAMIGNSMTFALIDLSLGSSRKKRFLNREDVDSKARDIFWHIRENYPDLPVYILQNEAEKLNAEERRSFLREGVRGFISLTGDPGELAESLEEISETIHQQNSVNALARANKLMTFETSQSIEKRGKEAHITLFDFETTVAVEAEDSENILSNVSKPEVSFGEVIGAKDAKNELEFFIEYMKNPRKYAEAGVSAPKGVILYGPPGTGKTMLAKAMAAKSNATFISAEGNQFLRSHIGEGARKVHDLFATARKYAPSILFIDEIDAIAKERRGGEQSSEAEATLTALLTEMDGFRKDPSKPVFVLAATNFDVEPGRDKSLDQAFLRRFDRRIFIDLPGKKERHEYLSKKIGSSNAFDISENTLENIVIRSTGMSIAAIESFLELSLRMAIRDGNMKVTDKILQEAFDTFNSGESKVWDNAILERVARHEAGHAFICWDSGGTPSYVTIVARASYGGYMQHDNEDKKVLTKEDLLAKIRTFLGGRAAEIVYYGEANGISTSAWGDLRSASLTASSLICDYGMDEHFGLAVIDRDAAKTGELSIEVREAVNKILKEEMKNAVRIIEANREAVDALVNRLLSQNHLTGAEIEEVFGTHCRS